MKWPLLSKTVASSYIAAMLQALFMQAIFYVLTIGCILDFGHSNWCALTAVCAHWAGIVMVLVRRPDAPTASDLSFIRIGYFPIFVASILLAPYIQQIRGPQSLTEQWLGIRLMPADGASSPALALVCVVWIAAYFVVVAYRKEDDPATSKVPVDHVEEAEPR